MKFRGTYLTAAVALALGAYTYREYRNAVGAPEPVAGERAAFTFKRDQIDFIDLAGGGGAGVTLEKAGGSWLVTKPVRDQADASAVDSFLYSLTSQRLREFREAEGGDVKWAEYGLQPAASTLDVGEKGARQKLEVAAKSAYDGSPYVRQKESVYLGDKGLAALAERPAAGFRSRRPWREDDAKISSVSVTRADGEFTFRKDEAKGKGEWNLEPKPAFPVDNQKFEAWVNQIEAFQAAEIVKDDFTDADREKFLLKRPRQTVKIAYAAKDGPREWSLTLGQDLAGDSYLFSGARSTLYKSGRAQAQALEANSSYFRDGHAPFAFDVANAARVRVARGSFKREFQKDGAEWKLVDAKPGESLVTDKLVQLITRARALEAAEFPSKGPSAAKTDIEIEIRDAAGKPVFALRSGEEYKSTLPWNAGRAFVAASVGPATTVVGLPKTEIERLVDPTMVAVAVVRPAETAKPTAAGKSTDGGKPAKAHP